MQDVQLAFRLNQEKMKKITLPDLPGESRKYLLFPRTTELIQQRPESLFHGNDLRGPESICPCKSVTVIHVPLESVI